jgi:malate synthase
LSNGRTATPELFATALAEESAVVRRELGEARWTGGRFDEAASLLSSLCLEAEFSEFLTLGAYRQL